MSTPILFETDRGVARILRDGIVVGPWIETVQEDRAAARVEVGEIHLVAQLRFRLRVERQLIGAESDAHGHVVREDVVDELGDRHPALAGHELEAVDGLAIVRKHHDRESASDQRTRPHESHGRQPIAQDQRDAEGEGHQRGREDARWRRAEREGGGDQEETASEHRAGRAGFGGAPRAQGQDGRPQPQESDPDVVGAPDEGLVVKEIEAQGICDLTRGVELTSPFRAVASTRREDVGGDGRVHEGDGPDRGESDHRIPASGTREPREHHDGSREECIGRDRPDAKQTHDAECSEGKTPFSGSRSCCQTSTPLSIANSETSP